MQDSSIDINKPGDPFIDHPVYFSYRLYQRFYLMPHPLFFLHFKINLKNKFYCYPKIYIILKGMFHYHLMSEK